MNEKEQDQWAQWLLQRRHGGDQKYFQEMLSVLYQYRDTVLQHANITPGDTLLDIGCGDGLIAFGALPLVGERGKVIFSDISRDLLQHCQTLVLQKGFQNRCQFIQTSAEDLSVIETNSVDVVTVRSVLIYIQKKQEALREFYRVLKPHGRLSLFEPIIGFAVPEPPHIFYGYDVTPIKPIIQKLRPTPEYSQAASVDSMLYFDERDLFRFAEEAGFAEIHLDLKLALVSGSGERGSGGQNIAWETFLKSSLNPLASTLEEVLHQILTEDEIYQFTTYLQPMVEKKQKTDRSAVAYLWTVKR